MIRTKQGSKKEQNEEQKEFMEYLKVLNFTIDNDFDSSESVEEGLVKRIKPKQRKYFILDKSIVNLNNILDSTLPTDDVIKLISFTGGFASISFIGYVVEKENILELTASTLRIGEKQFNYLAELQEAGKLFKATYFISPFMRQDQKLQDKYNYYKHFNEVCLRYNWEKVVVNNHSKIILMRTENNYYVLETSSNLNENPKIEHYSFENDKELYDFYYDFFQQLKERRVQENG